MTTKSGKRAARQVTFHQRDHNMTTTDYSEMSKDELMLKLRMLKSHADAMEHGIPLLCLKTEDEIV